MKLSIRTLLLGSLALYFLIMVAVFYNYNRTQQNKEATIIAKNISTALSELAYMLNKHLQKEPITTAKPLVDRWAANTQYVEAIALFDNTKAIVSSDPHFIHPIESIHTPIDTYTFSSDKLLKYRAFEGSVHYFIDDNYKVYRLFFYIDHKALEQAFTYNTNQFYLLLALIPTILLLAVWYMLKHYIIDPLEYLRRYAYYSEKVPKPFAILELEYIRASLKQTFNRLKHEREELYRLSRTDTLSGVANRNSLQERMEVILAHAKRINQEFALLFLDLDHFKSINDSLGHDIGDELLKNVASTIKEAIRIDDVVARIGGDEFVIVLTNYKDERELIDIIQRIQSRLMKPLSIKGYSINVSSSVGVAIYPKDGESLLELMKHADVAMYEAKALGRRRYYFFTEELNKKTQEYIDLSIKMRSALKEGEYQLFYQPQNSVKTGEIIGAEALIRWFNEQKGPITPDIFIPIAEHNSFIVELGKWILQTAIAQKAKWEQEGNDIKLSINIAAKQLQDKSFIPELKSLLERYSINRSKLYFEITEYIFIDNESSVLETFNAIRSLGIAIALDDFGTGYSSLSYLKRFPIDTLKIDKSFIDDIDNEDGAIFVETIIKMAQTLKMGVVAEGVETQEQLDFLKALSCDTYQGYLCSKPLDIESFNTLQSELCEH